MIRVTVRPGLLGSDVLLIFFLLLGKMGPLPGGQRVHRSAVGRGSLRADQALLPRSGKLFIHLVLAVQTLKCPGLVRGMRFGVVLRNSISGVAVAVIHSGFTGCVWAAEAARGLCAIDVGTRDE